MLVERVNELRTSRRELTPLDRSECVAQQAQAHATDMKTNGYLSHTTPDGEIQTERSAEYGGFSGENNAKMYVNHEYQPPTGRGPTE